MNGLPVRDLAAMAPVAVLTLGALALLMSEVFLTASGRRGYQAVGTMITAAVATVFAVVGPPAGSVFGGQATVDAFSVFVTVVVNMGVGLSALVSAGWLRARDAERGEYYALTLFAAAGMVLLGMASDLLVAFVAIEIMSLSTYALTAFQRRGRRPSEAAFKYMILGAISSALLLYGSSLIYGATGTTLFSGMHGGRGAGSLLLVAGLGLVASGIAFKVAAVPFHAWTPDVYEGAPTPVTAFMAAGVKTAAFALLARIFLSSQTGAQVADLSFEKILTVLAILTMVFGNLLALPQRSVKRMLAYSSVAHAGYLLVGVVSAKVEGARSIALAGVLFYLAAYTATAIGAFAVVGAIESRDSGEEPKGAWDLSRFSGLARRNPLLAFVMTVFLLSLAGVPPTAGFVGKLYIFKAAVGAELYGLAITGVLTSILGAFYYLRVIVHMYMKPGEGEEPVVAAPTMALALGCAVAVVAILGVFGDPLVRLAQAASAVVM
ncbi:MAG: NADH-quinone oxidoreductase subunit N [Anaeromyxobacter sp.]|nr:NADH-quinone oxidoreductase subunit N [Anaeromyxobacter sp.]MBL0275270.1 NADH-quinone oxidoreductase subunit N [Anaeromyxobacter sp.]